MSKYCAHGSKFSYENATKRPAPRSWQAKQVWVCNSCEKIHHAVQEEHQNVRGPLGATALLNADGRSTGVHYLTWATPNGHVQTIEFIPYPRTIPMSHPEPLLFSLWELLQSKVAVIMEATDKNDPMLLNAKAQARGLAEGMAILMKPFMENPDAVVRHAVAYYKDNSYEVPGLGTHLWNPLDHAAKTAPPVQRPRTGVKQATPPKPPAKPAAKALSEADIAFIKASAEMFSKEDLAGMMKVSVSVIESVIA